MEIQKYEGGTIERLNNGQYVHRKNDKVSEPYGSVAALMHGVKPEPRTRKVHEDAKRAPADTEQQVTEDAQDGEQTAEQSAAPAKPKRSRSKKAS